MGFVPNEYAPVRLAQQVTLFFFVTAAARWVLVLILTLFGPLHVPQLAGLRGWSPLISLVFTALYGVASWGLARRDLRAGYLTLGLFSWSLFHLILRAPKAGMGSLLSAVISVACIVVAVRAIRALRLRAPRPRGEGYASSP